MAERIAIYSRVSTDDQADRGYSLPSQIEACRQYAERLGYSVIAELREDESGATPIADRRQGRQLTRIIGRHEVDTVVVHQVDQLSRDIVDLLVTVRSWLQAGIEIYTLDVGRVESELDIVLVIKGWQGSDERKKIRERSMRGKRAKAQSGRVIGGRPPYGYRHTRDRNGSIVSFEPVEDESRIVSLIFQWYVSGDESGKRLSAGEIARKLSAMRVPTPGEVRKGCPRKRGAGMWQPVAVLDIISREAYAGNWRYGVRIGPTRNRRPEDEWISVKVPSIVDRTIWLQAQKQRERNKQYAKRNAKHAYLLSGLVRCSCGAARCGEYFSDHRYYTCTWKNNHHIGLEKRKCQAGSVRADALEADIWESIVQLFNDSRELKRLLRVAQQEELNDLDPKREELNTVEAMIIQAEREARQIANAVKRAKGIIAKSLEDEMAIINERYDALCERRRKLQATVESARLTDDAVQQVLDFAADVRVGIQNADFQTKRRNLELLEVHVTVNEGHFEVESLAGHWEGQIRTPEPLPKPGIVQTSHSRGTVRLEFRSPVIPAQPEA